MWENNATQPTNNNNRQTPYQEQSRYNNHIISDISHNTNCTIICMYVYIYIP
jgi:hypothetical protein